MDPLIQPTPVAGQIFDEVIHALGQYLATRRENAWQPGTQEVPPLPHRDPTERFQEDASATKNPESREMYLRLAAQEFALAECLEAQVRVEAGALEYSPMAAGDWWIDSLASRVR